MKITAYKKMANRIRDCKTEEDVKKCEQSLVRQYNAGIWSDTQLMRLDGLVLDQYVKIEHG